VRSDYECEVCVGFFDEALNPLLDILAGQGGIAGSCYEICSKLPGQVLPTVCTALCTFVGIYEFVNLLNSFNPEPQSICMFLHQCYSNPYAAGKVTLVKSSPPSGPRGTQFFLSAGYTITNTTGLGQTLLTVFPMDNSTPWQYEVDFYSLTPGKYSISGGFVALPQIPYPMLPGGYVVTCEVCEGQCGGGHSNEFLIAQGSSSFTITKS